MTAHTCGTGRSLRCAACAQFEVELWDAIHRYATTVGGDPSRHVYGYVSQAVADVNSVISRLREQLAQRVPDLSVQVLEVDGDLLLSEDALRQVLETCRWVLAHGCGDVFVELDPARCQELLPELVRLSGVVRCFREQSHPVLVVIPPGTVLDRASRDAIVRAGALPFFAPSDYDQGCEAAERFGVLRRYVRQLRSPGGPSAQGQGQ